MNYLSKMARLSHVMLAIVLSVLLVGNAQAVECKGKSQSACDNNASCSWVKGYKRSDGAKVSSFCRAKPGKSTGAAKKTSAKKTATKTDAKTKTSKKAVKKKTEKTKSDAKTKAKAESKTKSKTEKKKKTKKKAKKTDKKEKKDKKKS